VEVSETTSLLPFQPSLCPMRFSYRRGSGQKGVCGGHSGSREAVVGFSTLHLSGTANGHIVNTRYILGGPG